MSHTAFRNRFYVPELISAGVVQLSKEEGKHCIQVLRHQIGDRVVLFDGKGHEAIGAIESIQARTVSLRVSEYIETPSLPCAIHLAQAIPKGKTIDLIIQKAVELGATAVHPLLSDRTIVDLEKKDRLKKQEKWQTIAIEACKQCGQNQLPHITLPVPLAEFTPPSCELNLIASLQPDARPLKEVLHHFTNKEGHNPRSVLIFVGPEGDFTPAELEKARDVGCQSVSLGPIILRVETAAIYCLSALAYELF